MFSNIGNSEVPDPRKAVPPVLTGEGCEGRTGAKLTFLLTSFLLVSFESGLSPEDP